MKKPISADEAIKRMKKLCKSLGIPMSTTGKSGTASIHFINKPKKSLVDDLTEKPKKSLVDSKNKYRGIIGGKNEHKEMEEAVVALMDKLALKNKKEVEALKRREVAKKSNK
jgi:hypothetical protein